MNVVLLFRQLFGSQSIYVSVCLPFPYNSKTLSVSGQLPFFLLFFGVSPSLLCFSSSGKSCHCYLLCIILFIYEAAIVAESNIRIPGFASFMAFSYCFCHSPLALKIDHLGQTIKPCGTVEKGQKLPFPIRSNGAELCNQRIVRSGVNLTRDWSFIGGSRVVVKPKVMRLVTYRKATRVYASWLSGSQVASSVFTLGTTAVLPFYTLMILAPNSELTKRSMESSVPYVVLGALYAYLLYLSWTPETVGLIFASEYFLPELTSIEKMFSGEMTLASAWIHLLVVDLFAARQVFQDGLENQIETRHSVSLCLFFCPIGILTHVITKAMTKTTRKNKHGL